MPAMSSHPFDLTGINAVVTGGAMGIGLGIVECFLEAGANVLIADLDEQAARAAAEKLVRGPGKAAWIAVDVAAEGAGQRMVDECVGQFGSLDVFVNNAGIYPMVPALEMTPEMFDSVYRVNLKGLVFCSQAAALRMIEQGSAGRIVNIGSIDSFHPSAVGLSAYDSSKGAVLMFTKNLALELAPHHILVNMIAPGGIETPGATRPAEASGMTPDQMEAMRESFTRQIPLERFGTPREIGHAAVFFASPASGYVTGTALVVDGGRLLR
jgi:2-dehydro-3-deoxy-D-gluconate 5-dehydrogenase